MQHPKGNTWAAPFHVLQKTYPLLKEAVPLAAFSELGSHWNGHQAVEKEGLEGDMEGQNLH